MAQLSHWLPESWRESFAHLRDDLYDIAERWLPRRHRGTHAAHDVLPVRHQQPQDDFDGSPAAFLTRSPSLEIDETDDELLVTTELPGLDPDDFAIEVTGERLVIRGEKKQESTRSGRGFTYSERRYGAFARALQLPCEIDTDNAKALVVSPVVSAS